MRIFSWKNFKVRTARDRQPYKWAYKGHQRYNLSIIFTFRVITQFDIRLHHYTACVYISMEREIQTMRIYFLEEFQSADSARSTALQRAYKGHQDIISLIVTFRVITQFDIRSHHYTACVYSMEREIQTMRIYFLEEFQSADSARSTVLQRAYKGHQRYNPYNFYFPRYNSFWYSFAPLYSVCI